MHDRQDTFARTPKALFVVVVVLTVLEKKLKIVLQVSQ